MDDDEWNPTKITFLGHMIAGSAAGLAEHVTIFPIDTIKTHVQCERCGSISPMQTLNCAARIVHREGVFRLWRGVSAMFMGCIPAHAAYFSIYESMKVLVGADQNGHTPLRAAACGATAAMSHDLCMNPFDTVKQRMQLGHYNNIGHCIRSIYSLEGVSAFYLSFPTTLLMNIPYGCIMVSVNESMKKVLNPSGGYSFTASMIAGITAGSVAAMLTNPLDIVKTRLQTQSLEPCPSPAAPGTSVIVRHSVRSPVQPVSALDVAKQILATEGPLGFARGCVPRMLVHAPSVAISWTTYETAKAFLTIT